VGDKSRENRPKDVYISKTSCDGIRHYYIHIAYHGISKIFQMIIWFNNKTKDIFMPLLEKLCVSVVVGHKGGLLEGYFFR